MSDVHEVFVPGARLRVEAAGGGEPPLLLLHGLASDRRIWDLVWDDLTAGRRVIRYDLRGFGASVASDDQPFRHSVDLARLLDALRIERCDLVGVSLGGSVALNCALDHPERVRKLVLVSPGMTAWEWSDEWRALWGAIVEAAQADGLDRARALWRAHPLFATTRDLPHAAEILQQTLRDYSGAVWSEGDREAPALPDLDRLPFLEVPTLLLTGALDLPDFRLIAELIEAAAPDVRRIDFDGAGHMLNLERPREVSTEILRFLADA
ncbi:alpha/beta hydrolase [Phenylobacterium sp. LjRoot225]|uniref:alpha/beta fold hydrolase n=1 Tax=Phenylobacterium sp. LjRoot225 TaxID=3342285 RepID=UPI003ECDE15E